MSKVFGAVDIGASGGRVMAGRVVDGVVELEAVHRFSNGVVERDGHLRWDLTALFQEVLTGLAALASEHPDVVSVGIDTWAVDYGLLDGHGNLLAEPVAYRDRRTDGVAERVHGRVSHAELYAINGLQFLPFNTLYQLAAEQDGDLWSRATHALLIPDLLTYWLTGELRTEATNASTTGLFDASTRRWSADLLDRLEVPRDLFPPLVEPGEVVGRITAEVAARTGLSRHTTVVAVGSHDTASAVVGVPATNPHFAYVSSGTWSLVGVELDQPVLTDQSREANFTNEGGVDGRIRFLRNVGGLWLLQESIRSWRADGEPADLGTLLAEAAELEGNGPTVDVDDVAFIAPGDMPDRIRSACADSGQPAPSSSAAVVRCILDSLAQAYATTVQQAQELSGRPVEVIHIVGGGSQNELLCQLTADLSGLPVLARPVEATALGNIMVQARTHGSLVGDLEQLRSVLNAQLDLYRYDPQPDVSLLTKVHV
ncbi:MAG TPA: rhamnulokinase family protein [Propionibacteriaceae bacterium]